MNAWLNFYTSRSLQPEAKPFVWKKPLARSQSLQIPSATFNTRPLCQLIRIHKTPAVTLRETPHPGVEDDSTVLNYDDKRPESRVVKTTMGKMYKDKKFLQHLVVDDQFPGMLPNLIFIVNYVTPFFWFTLIKSYFRRV